MKKKACLGLFSLIFVWGIYGQADYFAVKIEQGGKPVPIQDHKVRLAKKEFTLMISFNMEKVQEIVVLAQFSLQDTFVKGFLAGKSLDEIVTPFYTDSKVFSQAYLEGAMTGAESYLNEEKYMHLDDYVNHGLFYDNEKENRFNKVYEENGTLICYRTIANYTIEGDLSPLAELDAEKVYVCLIYSESQNGQKVIRQWVCFEIIFDE